MSLPVRFVRYACKACGQMHTAWAPRCSSCNAMQVERVENAQLPPATAAAAEVMRLTYGAPPLEPTLTTPPRLTIAPAPDISPIASATASASSLPVPICDVEETSFRRHRTGIQPLDDVLGGGLVAGSVVLLGAEPGSGKSTLLAQALDGLHCKCLYATGEETVAQAANRARRIDADSRLVYIVAETRLEKIFEHALALRVEVLAIDSIQKVTWEEANGSAGSPSQVKACAAQCVKFAKRADVTPGDEIAIIIISQVNADNAISGPRAIEHDVDTVIMMEMLKAEDRRLTLPKNRFGSTNVVGRLTMTPHGLEPTPEPLADEDEDSPTEH